MMLGLEAKILPQCLRRIRSSHRHAFSQAEPPSHHAHFPAAIAQSPCLTEPRPYEESQGQRQTRKRWHECGVANQCFLQSFFPVTLYPPTPGSNQRTHLSVNNIHFKFT